MNSPKMKRFRQVLIGFSIVSIVLLFVLRYQLSANPLLILLLFAPAMIGVLAYYFLQMREDIKRQVGMKLVLLGSVSRMGYLVCFGLFIAGGLVEPSNAKLSVSLRNAALAVCAIIIIASYMYQAGMRKWRAEQREVAERSSEELSEDDPALP